MRHRLVYIVLICGLILFLLGVSQIGLPPIPSEFWTGLLLGFGLMSAAAWIQRVGRRWTHEARARRAKRQTSELVTELTEQLCGEYSPYVIEAAEKLGEAQDTTAVPALLLVLEDCVNVQRPCWRDVAEALIHALARIGDRRALPLLYRLETVRGIGVISTIRSAIATIEPQTSLLRAGSADDSVPESLLRPASALEAESDPALLLRAK
jgi:HEAT repeat protein